MHRVLRQAQHHMAEQATGGIHGLLHEGDAIGGLRGRQSKRLTLRHQCLGRLVRPRHGLCTGAGRDALRELRNPAAG